MYADVHVNFRADNIDQFLWQALSTIAGQEVVNGQWHGHVISRKPDLIHITLAEL